MNPDNLLLGLLALYLLGLGTGIALGFVAWGLVP
jgi:hypothetical protein